MTSKNNPPRLAVWLLRHFGAGDSEALTGDLVEQWSEGRPSSWFWRQTLLVVATGVWRYWPAFLYAVATRVPDLFFISALRNAITSATHWWAFPWPLSQMMLDLSPTVTWELLALAILGAGLRVEGSFRWSSLFRTAGIRLALIPILQLAWAMVAASLPLFLALWFLVPVFAAVVGCRLANHFPGKMFQLRG